MKEVGRSEIEDAARWLLGDKAEGKGRRLEEWAAARGVDLKALVAWALDEANDSIRHADDLGKGGFRRIVQSMTVQAFITGMEAERRRRDGEELPAPPVDPGI